jgi:hypothetical protein
MKIKVTIIETRTYAASIEVANDFDSDTMPETDVIDLIRSVVLDSSTEIRQNRHRRLDKIERAP